ncbi:unnamed protein product [Larinioides sclopetarius]|uniref:Uncharacterized protein n=1 Tax=Larinioides sclopetarius TaxID=280406 RepID=A0AAV1ZKK2_9ARAC
MRLEVAYGIALGCFIGIIKVLCDYLIGGMHFLPSFIYYPLMNVFAVLSIGYFGACFALIYKRLFGND